MWIRQTQPFNYSKIFSLDSSAFSLLATTSKHTRTRRVISLSLSLRLGITTPHLLSHLDFFSNFSYLRYFGKVNIFKFKISWLFATLELLQLFFCFIICLSVSYLFLFCCSVIVGWNSGQGRSDLVAVFCVLSL